MDTLVRVILLLLLAATEGFLVAHVRSGFCLSASDSKVVVGTCNASSPQQRWTWARGAKLEHVQSHRCLWANASSAIPRHTRFARTVRCGAAPAWTCYDGAGTFGLVERPLYLSKQGLRVVLREQRFSTWSRYDEDSGGRTVKTPLCPPQGHSSFPPTTVHPSSITGPMLSLAIATTTNVTANPKIAKTRVAIGSTRNISKDSRTATIHPEDNERNRTKRTSTAVLIPTTATAAAIRSSQHTANNDVVSEKPALTMATTSTRSLLLAKGRKEKLWKTVPAYATTTSRGPTMFTTPATTSAVSTSATGPCTLATQEAPSTLAATQKCVVWQCGILGNFTIVLAVVMISISVSANAVEGSFLSDNSEEQPPTLAGVAVGGSHGRWPRGGLQE